MKSSPHLENSPPNHTDHTGKERPETPVGLELDQDRDADKKQVLFESAPEQFADLALAVVKLIGRAEYANALPGTEPPGHFALAIRDYSHSTAPNRRYPDLLTQRLLKAALLGVPSPYTDAELTGLAKQCTDRELDAIKVERRMRKSAAAPKDAFIGELLPVVDNLERAVTSGAPVGSSQLFQGVEMTLQQLRQLLVRHDIESDEIIGQTFSPNRHDAIAGPRSLCHARLL